MRKISSVIIVLSLLVGCGASSKSKGYEGIWQPDYEYEKMTEKSFDAEHFQSEIEEGSFEIIKFDEKYMYSESGLKKFEQDLDGIDGVPKFDYEYSFAEKINMFDDGGIIAYNKYQGKEGKELASLDGVYKIKFYYGVGSLVPVGKDFVVEVVKKGISDDQTLNLFESYMNKDGEDINERYEHYLSSQDQKNKRNNDFSEDEDEIVFEKFNSYLFPGRAEKSMSRALKVVSAELDEGSLQFVMMGGSFSIMCLSKDGQYMVLIIDDFPKVFKKVAEE